MLIFRTGEFNDIIGKLTPAHHTQTSSAGFPCSENNPRFSLNSKVSKLVFREDEFIIIKGVSTG